ncbi:hypothetical protein N5D52_20940 [Pseudomonas sp. GD03860]|uniref:hypothetical protein n=1 Tax=Pseudomonas TaxID=286 RepID=UPI0023645815|nr:MULTISPECIES: hypothetical protein [Pseudomonas]MDD2059023.1 hypothetical protein [Pseudomonas putida]MDH0639400.1 hypothetical protein [Pseudomonas sp. GD03860]
MPLMNTGWLETRMLSDKEHQAGDLLKQRFRRNRAQRINAAMLRQGSLWYDNFLTNNSLLDYFAVVLPGVRFGQGLTDFKDLANHNYRSILQALGTLEREESAFFDVFIQSGFYACHSTNSEHVVNGQHDLVLHSRRKLIEDKVIFPKRNTDSCDLFGLANDDNVFFSLEVGLPPRKNPLSGAGSRFGRTVYKVPFQHPVFSSSSLVLLDQLEMDIPTCRIKGISDQAKTILNGRSYTRRSICFYGSKSLPALALSVISVARLLAEKDRMVLLGFRSEGDLNELVRNLFRVEIRVPRMVGIRFGDYYKFKF